MFECYRNIIDDSLIKLLRRANLSPILCESMEYSLIGGGKRIRPCLMLSVTEMLGGDIEKAIPFACALEMMESPKSYKLRPGMTVSRSSTQRPLRVFLSRRTLLSLVSL